MVDGPKIGSCNNRSCFGRDHLKIQTNETVTRAPNSCSYAEIVSTSIDNALSFE